ncbi:C2 domain-containing protein [Scheffersomyces coipomensis]|uniref:C2 domain-containing protein n=1 Tax=Scheffersomyces coipomensis TaxID=1788519 RepID=UPI00315CE9C0
MATNPNEAVAATEQVEVKQAPLIDNGAVIGDKPKAAPIATAPSVATNGTATPTSKAETAPVPSLLVPSEDFDLSNVKSKPPPRKSVAPTFRGWKEVGGWGQDDVLTQEDETVDLLSKTSVVDTYLPPVIYGDWYHNVGYLVVGGLLSWFIGWFRFSVAPLFFVIVVFAILYRSSIKKYRTTLREQVQREFSIKSIETDYETMDWLNNFLEKFWFFLEPSISNIVCEQVNPILASSPAPGFIKALWIDSFSAGTKPPRIDCVKTLQGTNDDVVVMDWGFSFTPNALADASTKQLKNKINQKTIVKASIFGFPFQVAVSDIAGRGIARVRLRMMSSFPHVETINISFLEPPQFDFNSKIVSDAPWIWEVLAIPGLYPFINEMVKKYAGAMFFSPVSFQLNVQQLLSGYAFDSAIGVLAITASSARGLKGFSNIGNTLDPYLTFGFKKEVSARTKAISDTNKPVWNETIYITVNSLSEPLNITVVDYNEFRKDREVGSIQFDLEPLLGEAKQSNLTAPFIRNNKPVGELLFGLQYMPVLQAQKGADGAVAPPPELNTGIARIEIAEGRHLKDGEKAASTYAELYVNGKNILKTGVQKKTNNPGWGASKEEIVDNKAKAKVKVVIKNSHDKVIGTIQQSLSELIDATQTESNWHPLARGGEVRIAAAWKPVDLVYATGSGGYTPPIGAVRVSIERGEDLRNLEALGTVDPYARLLVNGFERARTVAADSTTNPTWNEIHYVTVSSSNQRLTIEVMDVERTQADRTLGSFDVRLSDIITKNEKGQYAEYVDKNKRTGRLIHKKGPKGVVTYSLSFYPILPVMTIEDLKEEAEEKAAAKKETDEKAAKEAAEKTAANGTKAEEAVKKVDESVAPDHKTEEDVEEDVDSNTSSKLKLSLEELVGYNSGIFIYEIFDGSLSKDDVYLQAFFDNHGYHDFVSQHIKSKKANIGTTGDVVIKELGFSKASFRIVKKKGDNRAETPIAEYNVPTLQLLKETYGKPSKIKLSGAGEAAFTIQCQWIPLIYQNGIPPADSITNTGILTINVLRAENLPAADRNGKSDPYVELYLNTDKESFFKSKKIKKTLDPTWNETTTVQIINKHDSFIKLVCNDWDMGPEKDDLLGIGKIPLKDVSAKEPFEVTLPLVGETGGNAGNVYLSLSFKPEFLLNVRKGSTTINPLGAVGAVGNVGLDAGKGVVKGVGSVGKGIGGAFKKGLNIGSKS